MLAVSKEALTLTRFDALLARGTVSAGINLIANPGFELDFATWVTSTHWAIVDSTTVTPNGFDANAAQADATIAGRTATLQSSRFEVSGLAEYYVGFAYAAPNKAPKNANNLTVKILWYDAPSGGTLLRTDIIFASPLKAKGEGMRYKTARVISPSGAMSGVFLAINKYGSSNTGARKGTLLDNVMVAGVITTPTLSGIDQYEYRGSSIYFRNLKFSWHWQAGCKRMAFRLYGPAEYLSFLLSTALGGHLEAHCTGERVFGGMLWSMFGQIGGRSVGVTLDSLSNYIKVPYASTYAIVSDAESILRYGRKDKVADKSFEVFGTAAKHGNLLLSESAFPRATAQDNAGAGSASADYLDIEAMGYFATLGWVTGLAPVFLGEYDTSQIIATMPATIYANKSILGSIAQDTVNDFISSDYALVESTGITAPEFQDAGAMTSQDMLLELVSLGTDTKRGIVCGVGADRRFYMRQRPTTRAYTRRADSDGKFSFYDSADNEVPRPLVRAGEFVTDGALTPSYEIVKGSDAAKDPANRFIVETEYDHENNDVRIELLGKRRIGLDLSKTLRRR